MGLHTHRYKTKVCLWWECFDVSVLKRNQSWQRREDCVTSPRPLPHHMLWDSSDDILQNSFPSPQYSSQAIALLYLEVERKKFNPKALYWVPLWKRLFPMLAAGFWLSAAEVVCVSDSHCECLPLLLVQFENSRNCSELQVLDCFTGRSSFWCA